MRNGTSGTTAGFYGPALDEVDGGLSEILVAGVKSQLEPGERILWVGRGSVRPLPAIRIFPAFFAAFLCGTSGFALMVLFGIYGLRKMNPAEMAFFLCLAPGALGGIAAVGMAWSWLRRRLWQRRIARSLYVVTDRRAIVARKTRAPDDVLLDVWTADDFNGTLCVEHGDGTGSVYFSYDGEVHEPDSGFEGIRDAKQVEGLIRELLLNAKPQAESYLTDWT